jgi:hypothetical protein
MAGFLADTESFWDAGMKAIAQHAVVAAELLRGKFLSGEC